LPKGFGVTPTSRLNGGLGGRRLRRQIDYIETAAKAHGVSVVIIVDIIHVWNISGKPPSLFAPEDPHAAQWVADNRTPGCKDR